MKKLLASVYVIIIVLTACGPVPAPEPTATIQPTYTPTSTSTPESVFVFGMGGDDVVTYLNKKGYGFGWVVARDGSHPSTYYGYYEDSRRGRAYKISTVGGEIDGRVVTLTHIEFTRGNTYIGEFKKLSILCGVPKEVINRITIITFDAIKQQSTVKERIGNFIVVGWTVSEYLIVEVKYSYTYE